MKSLFPWYQASLVFNKEVEIQGLKELPDHFCFTIYGQRKYHTVFPEETSREKIYLTLR